MIQQLKNKLRRWIFPEYHMLCMFMSEYPKIKSFMEEINDAKISARKRSINTTEPIVLVGNLENCKVNINPSLYPEIVLSKIDYSALLELSGSYNAVTGSQFLSTQPQQRMKSK